MQTDPTIPAVKFTLRNGILTEYTPGPTLRTLIYHQTTIAEALTDLKKGIPIYIDASDQAALTIIRDQAPKPAPQGCLHGFWRAIIEWYWR